MKRTSSYIVKKRDEILEMTCIESVYELMNLSVSDAISMIGSDEIDGLLIRLLLESTHEMYENEYDFRFLDAYEGHQYVCDIFELNGFTENPEWFYEMTVKEFLELEDLIPDNIPFLTERLKRYTEDGVMLIPERYNFCEDESYPYYLEMMEAC